MQCNPATVNIAARFGSAPSDIRRGSLHEKAQMTLSPPLKGLAAYSNGSACRFRAAETVHSMLGPVGAARLFAPLPISVREPSPSAPPKRGESKANKCMAIEGRLERRPKSLQWWRALSCQSGFGYFRSWATGRFGSRFNARRFPVGLWAQLSPECPVSGAWLLPFQTQKPSWSHDGFLWSFLEHLMVS